MEEQSPFSHEEVFLMSSQYATVPLSSQSQASTTQMQQRLDLFLPQTSAVRLALPQAAGKQPLSIPGRNGEPPFACGSASVALAPGLVSASDIW
jgi:hypothetical protein